MCLNDSITAVGAYLLLTADNGLFKLSQELYRDGDALFGGAHFLLVFRLVKNPQIKVMPSFIFTKTDENTVILVAVKAVENLIVHDGLQTSCVK